MKLRGIYKHGQNDDSQVKAISNNTGAVALVLVVWVVIVLMAIVGQFAYSMRTEINIVKNFKEEEEAYYLAMAGIEQAKLEILSAKESDVMYIGEGDKLLLKIDDQEGGPVRSDKLGKGGFEYTITDEDAKLSLNNASLEQLKYLFVSTGVDAGDVDTIVDSIIDWRDPNDLHMLNGAEEDYYQSLDKPYSCKDSPFDSIDELLLVKGMTPEILNGSKGDDEKEATEGVAKYLTVQKTDRLNINTAPQIVLETVLGLETAGNIIVWRENAPITSPIANGKVASSFFTVVSTGTNADESIKRTIKTVLRKTNKNVEIVYWNDNII